MSFEFLKYVAKYSIKGTKSQCAETLWMVPRSLVRQRLDGFRIWDGLGMFKPWWLWHNVQLFMLLALFAIWSAVIYCTMVEEKPWPRRFTAHRTGAKAVCGARSLGSSFTTCSQNFLRCWSRFGGFWSMARDARPQDSRGEQGWY